MVLLVSCGGENEDLSPPDDSQTTVVESDVEFDADEYLPPSIDAFRIAKDTTNKVITRGEAAEYLGESSAHYLEYGLVGLVSTRYSVKEVPVYVEIAQFASDEGAYGHYASRRPDGIPVSKLGIESFVIGTTRYFVRGPYVVTLSTEDDADQSMTAMSGLAQEINGRLEGAATMPTYYILFPHRNQVAASAQYQPHDFLEIPGFDGVFTMDYVFDNDTATLFLAMDTSGRQFLNIRNHAERTGTLQALPDTIEYEGDLGVMFEDEVHGRIVAGLARQKVVGIVGYEPDLHDRVLALWVTGLQM